MNIIVTVKQVPNTTEIKIDPVTHTLKREGVPAIVNPDDKAALEEALVLKDKYGAKVTVLCMGPPQAEKALRETLAMGADQVVLLTDRAFAGSDTLATSRILSAAIKKIGFDLIISGRQAIDGDTAQVGPETAELLGIPQVTYVEKIDYDEKAGEFIVTRRYETYTQRIAVSGPVLFTVLSGSNTPRYMHAAKIVAQDETAVVTMTLADIEVDLAGIGLKGSPTRVKSTFTRTPSAGGEKTELEPGEAARFIAEKLKEKYYI
jgi:electron transfer flavoprotein beta subunit